MADIYLPTVDELRSVLKRADQSAASVEAIRIPHGAVGGLFELVRPDAPPLVLKLYPDELVGRMRTESYVYRLLADDAAIPVPRVLTTDESRTAIGLPYLLMTKLDGDRLANLVDELSVESGTEIFGALGVVLRRIHRVEFGECGPIVDGGLVGRGTNATFLGALFDEQLRDFERFGGRSEPGTAIRRYVDQRRDLLDTGGGGVLCHNDYVPGNLHVRRTTGRWQVSGVVDVERAIVADPLFDVARISRSSPWADAFVAGYGVKVTENGDRDDRDRLALYELFHTLQLRNWFAQTAWTEQLPALDTELAVRTEA